MYIRPYNFYIYYENPFIGLKDRIVEVWSVAMYCNAKWTPKAWLPQRQQSLHVDPSDAMQPYLQIIPDW